MKFSFLTCTLLSLLAVAARAQKPEGPWQDCDGPTTHITTNSDAMLPAIASGRRLLVTCFTHAIRGSSIAAGQVRLASLSPPSRVATSSPSTAPTIPPRSRSAASSPCRTSACRCATSV